MKYTCFLFLSLLALSAGKGLYWIKGGFRMERLVPRSMHEWGENSFLSEEAKGAFRQNYFYLNRGRQCYAFISEDKKYVLKLPRFDHFRSPFWLKALPFLDRYRREEMEDREKRYRFLFQSFEIASQEIPHETALVYLHLQKTKELGKVFIQDAAKQKYPLNLDRAVFALQLYQPLMIPELEKKITSLDIEGAEQILNALLSYLSERKKLGILNKDGSFLRNFSYDGSKVTQIDIGSFYRNSSLRKLNQIVEEATTPVIEWLFERDKDLAEWFKQEIKKI